MTVAWLFGWSGAPSQPVREIVRECNKVTQILLQRSSLLTHPYDTASQTPDTRGLGSGLVSD